MASTRKPYSPEFRQEMVALVQAGRTPAELAREYEPSASTIRTWVKQAETDAANDAPDATMDAVGDVAEAAADLSDAAADTVSDAADAAVDAVGDATDTATDMADQARASSDDAADAAKQNAEKTQGGIEDLIRRVSDALGIDE
ncbi:MAG: transposase [Chloroflexota bacterium]|nr:transposase [Chloroflexota bacterium]